MVLFFPIQQDIDCINSSGRILGKIKYDGYKDEYKFYPDSESVVLSDIEKSTIEERLLGLVSGKYSMSMQDDD